MRLRVLSLVVGSLLTLATPWSFPIALSQELSEANADSPKGGSQQAGSQDQAKEGKAASTQTSDQSAEPNKPGQADSSSDNGKDQDGKPAHGDSARHAKKNGTKVSSSTQQPMAQTGGTGKSAIQSTAEQILISLDAAINVAQKSGSLGAATSGKQGDDIRARRDQLQQKAQTAKDESAWTDVAVGGASALTDTLKFIEASPGSAAPKNGESETNHASKPAADSQSSISRAPQLPLYLATISLVVSAIALGGGWLLARREINKALIEAGLL